MISPGLWLEKRIVSDWLYSLRQCLKCLMMWWCESWDGKTRKWWLYWFYIGYPALVWPSLSGLDSSTTLSPNMNKQLQRWFIPVVDHIYFVSSDNIQHSLLFCSNTKSDCLYFCLTMFWRMMLGWWGDKWAASVLSCESSTQHTKMCPEIETHNPALLWLGQSHKFWAAWSWGRPHNFLQHLKILSSISLCNFILKTKLTSFFRNYFKRMNDK